MIFASGNSRTSFLLGIGPDSSAATWPSSCEGNIFTPSTMLFTKEEDQQHRVEYTGRFAGERFARETYRFAWQVPRESVWSNHARKLEQIVLGRP